MALPPPDRSLAVLLADAGGSGLAVGADHLPVRLDGADFQPGVESDTEFDATIRLVGEKLNRLAVDSTGNPKRLALLALGEASVELNL